MAATVASAPATPAPPSPERRRQLAEATVATQFETIASAARGCDIIVAATALHVLVGSGNSLALCRTPTMNRLQTRCIVIYNVDTVAKNLGAFEQAILLSLAHPRTPLGRERYGRAILKEVQDRLTRDVSPGAVYATLDRLEQKRLISSWVEPGNAIRAGRPRRHYSIEPKGVRALHASRAATDRLWAGVRLQVKGPA